jgi:hypothetical protein
MREKSGAVNRPPQVPRLGECESHERVACRAPEITSPNGKITAALSLEAM